MISQLNMPVIVQALGDVLTNSFVELVLHFFIKAKVNNFSVRTIVIFMADS